MYRREENYQKHIYNILQLLFRATIIKPGVKSARFQYSSSELSELLFIHDQSVTDLRS